MAKIEAKQVVVNEIREKVEKASSIVLVNARGLTVEQDTILRRDLREAGVEYKVYKNSMINFAIKDTEFEGLSEFLKGPTTVAFSYDDPTTAAGILSKHQKEIDALEFKAGVIEKTIYDAKGMLVVASIPSREVLISKLLGSFKSPMAGFARLIDAIAKDKEEKEQA